MMIWKYFLLFGSKVLTYKIWSNIVHHGQIQKVDFRPKESGYFITYNASNNTMRSTPQKGGLKTTNHCLY